jgi:hypothetical protein
LLNITFYDNLPVDAIVVLYDVLGALVVRQKLTYGINQLDLVNLAAGPYIYEIRDKDVSIGKGKIVKL